MSRLTERLRAEMRRGENYVRPESGVLRFCILPTDLNALLLAVESTMLSDAPITGRLRDFADGAERLHHLASYRRELRTLLLEAAAVVAALTPTPTTTEDDSARQIPPSPLGATGSPRSPQPNGAEHIEPRDIKLLRDTVSMLAHFVWHRTTRPGDHLWSIPVDKERDWDCILTDAIDELEQLREAGKADPARILKSDGSQATGSAPEDDDLCPACGGATKANRPFMPCRDRWHLEPEPHPQRVIATDTVTGVQRESVQGADARAEGPTTQIGQGTDMPIYTPAHAQEDAERDAAQGISLSPVAAQAEGPTTETPEHKPGCAAVSHRRCDDGGVTFAWPAKDCTCGLREPVAAPGAEDATILNGDVATWKEAALILGEGLASIGPTGYYDFTPEQWLVWAKGAGASAPAAGSATPSPKCSHCGWPLETHRPPGCPCAECGEYGHRWVDCASVRAGVVPPVDPAQET